MLRAMLDLMIAIKIAIMRRFVSVPSVWLGTIRSEPIAQAAAKRRREARQIPRPTAAHHTRTDPGSGTIGIGVGVGVAKVTGLEEESLLELDELELDELELEPMPELALELELELELDVEAITGWTNSGVKVMPPEPGPKVTWKLRTPPGSKPLPAKVKPSACTF